MLADRVFHWLLDDERAPYAELLGSFRFFLLLHLTAEAWFVAMLEVPDRSTTSTIVHGLFHSRACLLPSLLVVATGLGTVGRRPRLASALAGLARLGFLIQTFPYTANHVFLEILCCLILAGFDPEVEEERGLTLGALRWVTVILFLYTGIQKAWYGCYFHGEFLAVALSWDDRYATFLRYLMSAEEFTRLRAIGQPFAGSGPYFVQSIPFLVVSNLVWIGEVLLAILLLPRFTRSIAVVGTIVFMLFTQLNAHELFFGGLFVNLALLFSTRNWIRYVLPPLAALYGFALLTRLSLVAGAYFN